LGVLTASFFIRPIWWLWVGCLYILASKFRFSIESGSNNLDLTFRRYGREALLEDNFVEKKWWGKTVDAARKNSITYGLCLIFLGPIGIIFFSRWNA
jgi:ACS family hexuronate transporter-like MFS transporter